MTHATSSSLVEMGEVIENGERKGIVKPTRGISATFSFTQRRWK